MDDLATDVRQVSGKTPTDVFNETVKLYLSFVALNGESSITPNEVYAQLVCATKDVMSILEQSDPACRYNVETAPVESGKTPSDVFRQCLNLRSEINIVRRNAGLGETPVPQSAIQELAPLDVFLQTQIIIAELNLLKRGTETISSTPLAIPVTGKTPSDCYQQVSFAVHLIKQVIPVRATYTR